VAPRVASPCSVPVPVGGALGASSPDAGRAALWSVGPRLPPSTALALRRPVIGRRKPPDARTGHDKAPTASTSCLAPADLAERQPCLAGKHCELLAPVVTVTVNVRCKATSCTSRPAALGRVPMLVVGNPPAADFAHRSFEAGRLVSAIQRSAAAVRGRFLMATSWRLGTTAF